MIEKDYLKKYSKIYRVFLNKELEFGGTDFPLWAIKCKDGSIEPHNLKNNSHKLLCYYSNINLSRKYIYSGIRKISSVLHGTFDLKTGVIHGCGLCRKFQ